MLSSLDTEKYSDKTSLSRILSIFSIIPVTNMRDSFSFIDVFISLTQSRHPSAKWISNPLSKHERKGVFYFLVIL